MFMMFCIKAQTSSKKVEVLFFYKNDSTLIAQSNKILENKIIEIINRNFTSEKVVFLSIDMDDEDNFSLVRKFKGKQQTLIVFNKKSGKLFDISKALLYYRKYENEDAFEEELIKRINQLL